MKNYPIRDGNTSQAALDTATLEITGNILSPQWMKYLRTPRSNQPYPCAALVLAEVIYRNKPWYDPDTDEWYKGFKSDKWQMNYQQVGDRWGYTKRQVREAVYYLRDLGLIAIEYRTITLANGDKLTKRPFVEPVVEQIIKISSPPAHVVTSDGPLTFATNAANNTSDNTSATNAANATSKRLPQMRQYTEIPNTEITLEDKKIPEPSAQAASEPSKKPEVKDKEPGGENGNGKANNPHQELLRLYQEALGYKIPNGGQEAAAAKKILRYYSPQDAIACYRWLKSDAFWAEKHLSLQSVYKQMGPWSKTGKPTYKNGKNNVVMSKQTIEESDAYNDDAVIKGVKMRRNKGFSDEEIYEHMKSIGFPAHEIDYYLSQ